MTNTPTDKTVIDAVADADRFFIGDVSDSNVVKSCTALQMYTYTIAAIGADSDPLYSASGFVGGVGSEDQITIDTVTYDTCYAAQTDSVSTGFCYLANRHATSAALPAAIAMAKSRGTLASESVVVDGDALATLAALGHDGTDYTFGATIDFVVNGTVGANTVPTDIIFKVEPNGGGSPTEVMRVVSDLTVKFSGDVNMNGNNLTDVHEIRLDATPDTDHTANGPTTNTINAGATIAIGELCYLASDGEWALADADAAATAKGMLSIALAAGTDGNPMLVALAGSFVRDDTWNWTIGAELYVSTTAGGLTETAPSATGDVVRVVGYAVNADVVYFNPGSTWVEIA